MSCGGTKCSRIQLVKPLPILGELITIGNGLYLPSANLHEIVVKSLEHLRSLAGIITYHSYY